VHVHLDGEIKFTDDTPYWQSVAYTHPFQNTIMFWKWGGQNIKIYGEGTLNGNGQRWWKYVLIPMFTFFTRPCSHYEGRMKSFPRDKHPG
jgi:hypothetical protein